MGVILRSFRGHLKVIKNNYVEDNVYVLQVLYTFHSTRWHYYLVTCIETF